MDTAGDAARSAFEPADADWTPVSPKLATVRRLLLLAALVPVTAVLAVLLGLAAGRLFAVGAATMGLLLAGWGWRVVGRAVRSWGYTERHEDLLIRHGLFYRRLVVVPYGRMQFVDVQAGPLDRAFGIASVQLHTAAAHTGARIDGLVPEEAARLRDRLAARGEAQSAGL